MQLFIKNIKQLLTLNTNGKNFKIKEELNNLGILENAAIYIEDDIIKWIGKTEDFNQELTEDSTTYDATGLIAFPGFVDCHTHVLYTSSRENEFAMRAKGKTYQQIAESGGGIQSTVQAVTYSDKRNLKKETDKRLDEMLAYGITTVEIKSGYGLNFKHEIKMLEAINELNNEHPIDIVPTFLGAHAYSPDYSKEDYIKLIIDEMIPYVSKKKLSKFCDVFCENGYFDLDAAQKILEAAKKYELTPKVHAEELSYTGAAELGVEMGAISVDHLENISDQGIQKLSSSKTVAVLLPGVSFFLGHKYAPARELIDSGARVAISTDMNPGSCMTCNMQLLLTIAITQLKMTIEEAICSATINAAAALGISESVGSIEVGKKADITLFRAPNYEYIPYHFGKNHAYIVIKSGKMLEW